MTRQSGDASDITAAGQIEEDMTDAGKASLFAAAVNLLADVRSRYPGEELRCPHMRALDEAVTSVAAPPDEPRIVRLTLAVAAGRALGKTTLLMFLLDAMADAGMLSTDATRRITESPWGFISASRTRNEINTETVEIDVDLNVLWDLRK